MSIHRRDAVLSMLLAMAASACGGMGKTGVRSDTAPAPARAIGPSVEAAPPKLTVDTLAVDGLRRSFTYFAPAAAPGEKLALVLALHGRLGTGHGQDKLSHLSTIAARERFIVVFPDGEHRSWHDNRERGPAADAGVDDVKFLGALVDRFVATAGADPARVYATGMSNGGFMSLTLGCRMSDRIAAFAAVAATAPAELADRCAPSRPVSALIVMGTEDPLVPYEGGAVARDEAAHGRAASAASTAKFWADRDGCTSSGTKVKPDASASDGTTTETTTYAGCREGSAVVLETVRGGGHTWPGGLAYMPERVIGRTSRDWDASEEIWAFFRDKRR